MALEIHVNVAVRPGPDAPLAAREVVERIQRAVRATLASHDLEEAEVSVTVLDDAAIADMNARYLGHDGPTDVISFELGPDGGPPIGDIYIGWEQALRQASGLGVPPAEEIARLAVHGTLHVLGYEHPEGELREQSEMWARQESIVREVVEP